MLDIYLIHISVISNKIFIHRWRYRYIMAIYKTNYKCDSSNHLEILAIHETSLRLRFVKIVTQYLFIKWTSVNYVLINVELQRRYEDLLNRYRNPLNHKQTDATPTVLKPHHTITNEIATNR